MFAKAFRRAAGLGSRGVHAQATSTRLRAGVLATAGAGVCFAAYSAGPSRAAQTESDGAVLRYCGAAVAGTALGGLTAWFIQARETQKAQEKLSLWPRKIMVLFGPPGVGKGTQAPKIVSLLDIPQLSTGDMLRAEQAKKSDLGKEATEHMTKGALVPDELVIRIIKDRIQAPDCQRGFILDGFPRTLAQAKALDAMLAEKGETISNVMSFEVPDAVLTDRISGRWIHAASGRSYHIKNNPPKSQKLDGSGKPIASSMKDDVTGEPLTVRPDDNVEALKKRLGAYHEQTVPILTHYQPRGVVHKINGDQGIDRVWTDVRQNIR